MKKRNSYDTKLGQINRNDESFWKPLFQDYLYNNETLGTLSDKLGLDTRTIRSIFEDFRWIKSETTHLKTKLGYISKDNFEDWKPFHNMYISGKSYEEVANHLGIQRKVLCKYFNLFGFEKRNMSDSCKSGVVKMKKTCNERLGVDFPTQSKEVKNKVKQTVLDKYSVDNIAKVPEIRNKISENNYTLSDESVVIVNEEVETMIKYNEINNNLVQIYGNRGKIFVNGFANKLRDMNQNYYEYEITLMCGSIQTKIKSNPKNYTIHTLRELEHKVDRLIAETIKECGISN